jgi:Calcineurin-like phosphoesterase
MRDNVIVVLICTTLLVSTVFTMVSINTNAKKTDSFHELDNRLILEFPNKYIINCDRTDNIVSQKSQLSFAAFADTHIGAKYQNPLYGMAGYLDHLGEDLVNGTNLLDFAVHLGDIVNHNTGHVNGIGLPWYVNQYKNNLKAYLISHINLPFYCVIGNHDVNDYEMNSDDPHNLTKSLIDELSMNNPVYAMMRDGILFLIVPELGYVQWTHPVEYEWIEYMTSLYPNTTTIIFCHQAIEDTTSEDTSEPYRGKQDMDWWANLFKNNPQIKMWIHGHNHYLDWYVNNQSTGKTYPIRQFGHEMAFSAPYSQMDWGNYYEEDRIVIYNISSTDITTTTWENNGAGGHWVSEYIHSWNMSTTYDPNFEDWYSFPMFIQDNETQLTDMKLLSPDITLQLIGTVPMELFYDARMESPSSKDKVKEIILGFGDDRSGNVVWTNPGMQVHGPTSITFPEKYPLQALQEDGRSGQPYQGFPMGTICSAVPGQTYNFTITARCLSGTGRFTMNVSCCDWGTKSQYSLLPGSENQVFSHAFGSSYETIHGKYTVPNDVNAWFLQGKLEFLDPTDYDVSLFSVKRERNSDTTDNFHLLLSGTWYNISATLAENEMVNFSINPKDLCDDDGVMNFTAFIDGNRYGMVNLIYREPLLMGINARFRVNSFTNGVFNLSLTKTISRNSAVNSIIWNSAFFQQSPRFTELMARFFIKCFTGNIFNKLLPQIYTTFKMFPFSTDSMYNQVDLAADDGSGAKHTSNNGNLWFSCNCPNSKERYIIVTLPIR